MSTYGFLRWLREGASAAVATPRSAAGPLQRATFTAILTLTDEFGQRGQANQELTLFGPGDLIGLDKRQVLRLSPAPDALDAAYEQFPHVEFDEPALPWLFTPFHEETSEPAGGSAALPQTGTVLPWIALVVVTERTGVELQYTPGAVLPVLHVDDVTKELPKLTEAHAWAHVQVTGGLPATVQGFEKLITGRSELTLSRLVCPRLLKPATRYLACVVPVFKAGVLAGLGRPLTGFSAAELAYDSTKPGPVDLPVYLTWSFTTAVEAGFKSLVRRLVPRSGDQLPDVGQRKMDASDPGLGVATPTDAIVALGGALRVPNRSPADADKDLRNALEDLVNQVDKVAPPLYGRWLAAVDKVPAAQTLPAWIRELNTEPRHRVAAGLGVQVVQAEQEALMAAAWEQLGDILRANQLLRQGQLALGVGGVLHGRHLAALGHYTLLQVAGPTLARIRSTDPTTTLHGVLEATCLPMVTLDACFRRVTRRRGPLARRAHPVAEVPIGFDIEKLLERLIGGNLPAPPAPPAEPATALGSDERNAVIAALQQPGHGHLSAHLREIGARLELLADRAAPAVCTGPADDPAARARDRLRPSVTLPPRVRAQVMLPATIAPVGDELEPVLAAPELKGAMYRSLTDLGQDWLLPGLEHVPPNTVTGLVPDDTFIEAFMVGLNHEMGRELLWRGYPTDQRGTVMARFWELVIAPAQIDKPPSIPPQIDKIHTWQQLTGLGSHRPPDTPPLGLVLLLRGDLIRQFPHPGIILAKAEWARDGTGKILQHPDGRPVRRPLPLAPKTTAVPLFAGRLEPDVLFLGFTPTADAVRGAEDATGDPGWFIMFAEQPTEPRFDLSAAAGKPDPTTGRLESWSDLGRDQVTIDPAGHIDLALTTAAQPFLAVIPKGDGVILWDGRSDTLAAILLHRPLRLYVHASDLLPTGGRA